MEEDTWQQWSKFVLAEMKRLHEQIESLDRKIDGLKDEQISQLKVEIAMLKVKSGVWGLIGGLIPVAVILIVEFTKGSQ
jgi:hypothetical protein